MAHERTIWKGLAAGAVSGLAATWIMTQYQVGSQKLMQKLKQSRSAEEQPGGWQNQQQPDNAENPTVTVAKKITGAVGAQVPEDKKQLAGNVVHYGFGTAMGVFYGLLSEFVPATTTARGVVYGAGLWAAADELTLPAAGLAKWWPEYPLEVHANALAAHIVYAKSMDEIYRGVRRLLDLAVEPSVKLGKTDFRPPRVHPRAARPVVVRARRFGGEPLSERERKKTRRVG